MKKLALATAFILALSSCKKDEVIVPDNYEQRDSTTKTDPYDRGKLPAVKNKIWK